MKGNWRVGSKVSLNVYDGDRPVCQCHSPVDAQEIVDAMNNSAALDAAEAQIFELESDRRKLGKAANSIWETPERSMLALARSLYRLCLDFAAGIKSK